MKMSNWSIAAYNKCQKYYELKVIKRLESPMNSSALIFGKTVHLGIESYLRGLDGLEIFEQFWQEAKTQDINYIGRETWDSLNTDGISLLSKFKKLHLKHFIPEFIEAPLEATYKDVMFKGTVDYAGKYKGIPVIMDFKTSSVRYAKERLIVDDQMPIYDFMLKANKNFIADEHYYLVLRKTGRDGEAGIQIIGYKPTDIDNRLENIYNIAKEAINKKEFFMNKTACMANGYKCDMFNICYKQE